MYEPKYKPAKQIMMCDYVCSLVIPLHSIVKNCYKDNISELGEVEVIELMDDGIAICTKDKTFLGIKDSGSIYNTKKTFSWNGYLCSKVACDNDLFKYDHIDTSYRYTQFDDPFEYMAAHGESHVAVYGIRAGIKSELEKINK